MKKSDIAKRFKIPPSSLSTIIKNKRDLLKKFYESETVPDRKKFRGSNYEDVEKALFQWFQGVRSKNIPLNGPILKEKALEFAKHFGHPDFTAGSGWLQRFKDRHGIIFRTISGESGAVDEKTVEKWLDSKEQLIKTFDPSDVFNADETGLFYRLLPDKTFALKGETCTGGKRSKVRLTALLCCNMDGSEKRKILIVGKSKNPRCLKNCKNLPVIYKANKKAWMTGELFGEWLKKFDEEMRKNGRKILLLIDNCSAHNTTFQLQNITLCRFPPNVTSKLQPLDMGIIKNVKVMYRKRILKKILLGLESGKDINVDVKTACEVLDDSWKNVTPETIKNCWKHAGFKLEGESNVHVGKTSESDQVWENLKEKGVIPNDANFEDYIAVDDQLATEEEKSDEDIIQSILAPVASDESDDDAVLEIKTQTSCKSAIESLETLRLFFGERDIDINETFNKIESKLCECVLKSTVQKKITDFFG